MSVPYKKKPVIDRPVKVVELPGFEPGQREPKSLVLPLHHNSIPRAKILLILFFCKSIYAARDGAAGLIVFCL